MTYGARTRGRAASVEAIGLLLAELVGALSLWAPIPAAWMWVGARVYDATASLMADLVVAFGGFTATTLLTMGALNHMDQLWVELRRRAGYDQREGVLTRIVVTSSGLAMAAFWVWFHIVKHAFIIPFMPMH